MIGFLIGAVLGGTVGVTAMCLARVASDSDDRLPFDDDSDISNDL
ncbi:MAG: DUF3789 domain-containing protein [Ruminococcus sp.]|nr:DUF3789 domain-containing protein [Ruminococcus sp.]